MAGSGSWVSTRAPAGQPVGDPGPGAPGRRRRQPRTGHAPVQPVPEPTPQPAGRGRQRRPAQRRGARARADGRLSKPEALNCPARNPSTASRGKANPEPHEEAASRPGRAFTYVELSALAHRLRVSDGAGFETVERGAHCPRKGRLILTACRHSLWSRRPWIGKNSPTVLARLASTPKQGFSSAQRAYSWLSSARNQASPGSSVKSLRQSPGGAAVFTIYPRVDKGIGPRQLRDRYLTRDPSITRMVLLNTRVELHAKDEERLIKKAQRVRVRHPAACRSRNDCHRRYREHVRGLGSQHDESSAHTIR